ncbi:MAG: alpha/beta hydrolase, partial [Chitinophagaceae bacterium]
MKLKITLMIFAFLGQILSGSSQVRVVKNINYAGTNSIENTLTIYHKKETLKNEDVIIFIHGGSWSSGKKETYWWLGRNLAKKNIVTAIINYPLAPKATYK